MNEIKYEIYDILSQNEELVNLSKDFSKNSKALLEESKKELEKYMEDYFKVSNIRSILKKILLEKSSKDFQKENDKNIFVKKLSEFFIKNFMKISYNEIGKNFDKILKDFFGKIQDKITEIQIYKNNKENIGHSVNFIQIIKKFMQDFEQTKPLIKSVCKNFINLGFCNYHLVFGLNSVNYYYNKEEIQSDVIEYLLKEKSFSYFKKNLQNGLENMLVNIINELIEQMKEIIYSGYSLLIEKECQNISDSLQKIQIVKEKIGILFKTIDF